MKTPTWFWFWLLLVAITTKTSFGGGKIKDDDATCPNLSFTNTVGRHKTHNIIAKVNAGIKSYISFIIENPDRFGGHVAIQFDLPTGVKLPKKLFGLGKAKIEVNNGIVTIGPIFMNKLKKKKVVLPFFTPKCLAGFDRDVASTVCKIDSNGNLICPINAQPIRVSLWLHVYVKVRQAYCSLSFSTSILLHTII